MAVTDTQGGGSTPDRLKAAAPVAAAVGIIAAIVGVSVLTGAPAQSPGQPAPPAEIVVTPDAPEPAPGIPGMVTTQNDQPGSVGGAQAGIEIVVKFKDDARVKDIIDAFWRDQSSARSKFDAWKAGRPEFAGLRLDRVTYSNELVLVHDGSLAPAERIVAMRTIAARLGSAADISYAEPNMTAHPGGQ